MTTDSLRRRAHTLGLHGIIANWDELSREPWLEALLTIEETERQRRGLERRVRNAKLGRFKPAADIDWSWPKRLDRLLIDELFTLRFIEEMTNVIFAGPNGVGKTMLAKNLAYQAILHGHTVKMTTASEMLADLGVAETATGLRRRVARYMRPRLLVIDEVGYLSYDNRNADMLFEVINARYQHKPIILTTNRPFSEWNEIFPNATCVVTLVDRLVHNAEIVNIEGGSFRLKEAKEQVAQRAKRRKSSREA